MLAVLEGEKDVDEFIKDQQNNEMALELYQGKIEDDEDDFRPSSRSETPENKQKAK